MPVLRMVDLTRGAVIHINSHALRGFAAIDLEGINTITLAREVDGVNPLWFRAETPDGRQQTVLVDEFEEAITSVDSPAIEVPNGNGSDE